MLTTPQNLDVEQFHHLVSTARSIAVARPGNLVKFAEMRELKLEDGAAKQPARSRAECQRFMESLSSAFWRLLGETPANSASGCLGQRGLTHVEVTVQSLVEIFHAFTLVDIDLAAFACDHYIQFLLCPDGRVSFPARAALVRAIRPRPRRRRILPTPPGPGPSQVLCCSSIHSIVLSASFGTKNNILLLFFQGPSGAGSVPRQATPRGTPEARPAAPAPPQRQNQPQENQEQQEFHEARDALNLGPGGVQLGGVAGNLEALLPMARGNLPAMLDLPHDMDDEVRNLTKGTYLHWNIDRQTAIR